VATRHFVKNEVVRWIDGDTVVLNVDLGFKIWSAQTFRLARINTPEKGKPGYAEAVNRVNQLAPVGSIVAIDCVGLDKYGRWVAEVFVPNALGMNISVNQTLISENLAVVY